MRKSLARLLLLLILLLLQLHTEVYVYEESSKVQLWKSIQSLFI